MTDPEVERLTIPNSTVSLPPFSSTVVSAPPFAPTPHYSLNIPECDGNVTYRTGSTSTGRSGTLITSNHAHIQASVKQDCNIHEVCHYIQQVVFVFAILTGITLVIAGGVMQNQTGELVVFVYIGTLLVSVNSALLSIQCYVRRKQKRRHRTYTASRSTVSAPVIPLSNNQQYSSVGPQNVQPTETLHYYVSHSPNMTGSALQPFLEGQLAAGSPTESQTTKYYSSMHNMVPLRPGSIGSHGHHYHHHHHHHHQHKDKYHHSPSLGQHFRSHGPATSNVPLLPTPRYVQSLVGTSRLKLQISGRHSPCGELSLDTGDYIPTYSTNLASKSTLTFITLKNLPLERQRRPDFND